MTINVLGKYGPCALALLCMSYTTAWGAISGPFSYNGNIDYFVDDNVGKAQSSSDIREDSGFTVTGGLTYSRGINRLSAFLASANITVEEFSDFDGLSNTKISASASYIFQNRISFKAPSFRLFIQLDSKDSETDIRDSTGFSLGGESKKRLTDKLRLNLGLTYSSEDAEGSVFDIDKIRLFANLDLQHNARTAIYTTFSYIDGGITSTTTANVPSALPFINNADAIEFDNAFGGQSTGQAAYRIDDATTLVFNLGTNVAIGQQSSVDFSIELINSSADDDIEYDRQIIRAVYLRRF